MEPDNEFGVIESKLNELAEKITNARFELDHAAKLIDQSRRELERLIINAGTSKE